VAANRQFGYAVALSDSYIVVGVPHEYKDFTIRESGSVEVFKRVYSSPTSFTYSWMSQLFLSSGAALDHLGYAVSIGGNYVAAGGPNRVYAAQASVVSGFVVSLTRSPPAGVFDPDDTCLILGCGRCMGVKRRVWYLDMGIGV
jgi:FG-GAP repeat